MLKTTREAPDVLEDYKQDYGYLGPALHAAVIKERQKAAAVPATPSNTNPFRPTITLPQVRLQDKYLYIFQNEMCREMLK